MGSEKAGRMASGSTQRTTHHIGRHRSCISFPINYFNHYKDIHCTNIAHTNWDRFLDDFQNCWETDLDNATVRSRYFEQIEHLMSGETSNCRFGRGDWFRLTDPVKAKSVFNFLTKDGDVAHSTHAGLPWLRHIRHELVKAEVRKVDFWPFDDWTVGKCRSVVVEVYPALYHPKFAEETEGWKNKHRRDAYSIARWMSDQDEKGEIERHFKPDLNARGRARARKEGWILGVRNPRDPEYAGGVD